ncbi:MAG: hypothetical protein ABIQ44_14185 [Chloroflexia bacterium]
MDALKRIVQPGAKEKGEREVRRVQPRRSAPKAPRLRAEERALSDALAQLMDGVPLNWGQVEDDAELLTLARLQGAAQEAKLEYAPEPPAEERAAWLGQKVRELPVPKKKLEKVAPKSMAGFSERVQVLTQVEEDVKMGANVPRALVRGAAMLGAVGLLVFGVIWFIGTFTTPGFAWIEVRKGSDVLNRVVRPSGWQEYPCKVERLKTTLQVEWFHTYTAMRIVSDKLTFGVPLLPSSVEAPSRTTLELSEAAVAPCKPDDEVSKDAGAMLRLEYNVSHSVVDANGPTPEPGSPTAEQKIVAPVVVYVAKEQPLPLSVRDGVWREVKLTDAHGGLDLHGVIWRGDGFHDRSGIAWYGEVIVLMVERGNMIMVLEGGSYDGVSEELLMEVARNVSW